ncbi:YceI family protein [Terricaulis silvestris]|uniref:Cytochrome b561 n=1 Tax=Terricaulis silvestris TaxID=2686094 RepID=A0A6I6MP48_9CAUL|nr:YceI family protein [Terricaulis silvestris]QGZ94557.1 Cytochrome b561 [Terricaulis silvestris]
MSATAQRYTAVAIVLHWAIAAAILFMIPLGLWMHEEAENGNVSQGLFEAYQLHKSIGLTVLALSVVRLGWRLANPPPPLPVHMPGWEKFVAKLTHWAFYALIIALPLTGWLYVSAGWSIHDEAPLPVPTHWFGLFEVPHLFGLNQASLDVREDAAEAALTTHAYLGFTALGLVALHVAAALKHHFFDRDETLAHMVPGVRAPFEKEAPPKNPVRLAVLGVGLSLVTVAAVAALFTVATLGSAAPQAPPSTFEAVEAEPTAPETPNVGAPDSAPVAPTAVPRWTVDARSSSIGFAYEYEDENGSTPFNGRFTRWRADIRFDPSNLDASSAVVRIETASASTGVTAHDGALPSAEWFNAGAHPMAEFRTTRIRSRGGNQYEARGRLTIRGQSRDVSLPFTLSIDGDRASMRGSTTIDRNDFGVGEGGSGDDLISRDIQLTIRVDATRAR